MDADWLERKKYKTYTCADRESFARGGPTFFLFFFFDKRKEDPNSSTKSGPSLARQRNAIYMAFRWRDDDGPTLNAGLAALWFFRGSGPVLLRNPIFLWFFRGEVRTPCPPPPPLDPHMTYISFNISDPVIHKCVIAGICYMGTCIFIVLYNVLCITKILHQYSQEWYINCSLQLCNEIIHHYFQEWVDHIIKKK